MTDPQHGAGSPQATELDRIRRAYLARDVSTAPNPYHFLSPGYSFYMQLLEESVLDALRRAPVDLASARVLEVGCGSGYFVNRLSEFGAAASSGVDLMPGRIEAARQRYPGHQFVCADATALPFADGEFELVTQFTCFSSVLDPGTRAAIAGEMWRVLRPGGAVVSYDIRPATPAIEAMRWLGRKRRGDDEEPTPTTGISAQELRRMFPHGELRFTSAGLAFGLCGVVTRSALAARLMARIPALREHAIALLSKPAA